MKRRYISPDIEIIECVPGTMVAASLPTDNSGPSTEDEFEGEATGAARGDWDNIWQGM